MIPALSDSLVVKLGSLALHAEELVESLYNHDHAGVQADIGAIRGLLSDHEVLALQLALDRQGLLPEKRR